MPNHKQDSDSGDVSVEDAECLEAPASEPEKDVISTSE